MKYCFVADITVKTISLQKNGGEDVSPVVYQIRIISRYVSVRVIITVNEIEYITIKDYLNFTIWAGWGRRGILSLACGVVASELFV